LSRQQAADPSAAGGPAAGRRWPGLRRPGPGLPSRPRFTLGLAIALQGVISAGDGLTMIALASRVYQNSHASWAVASVFLAVTVPITALAPVAGTVLDRFPPRPVLVSAAAAEALVALALILAGGTGATLGLAAGFGVCAAVLQPGLGAVVPRLAGRTGLTRANGYLQAATWGGFTLGPLLAAGLIAAGGPGLALAAVAAIYGLGALGLRALRLVPVAPAISVPVAPAISGRVAPAGSGAPQAAAAEPAEPAEPARLAGQMSAGLRFLRADREAGLLVIVVSVAVGFANMAVVAEVSFAEGVLKAGPSGYSILVAAWTAGMLAGTLAGGRLPMRRLAVATLTGTMAVGAGVALAGTALALWQAAAAYGFGGLANGFEVVATRSFLNHRVPEAISGRVFALYSGLLFGMASLGMAASGGVLSLLSPRAVLFLAGGGCAAAGAIGCLIHARRAPRPVR
jgi:MFS family permease